MEIPNNIILLSNPSLIRILEPFSTQFNRKNGGAIHKS